jgi:type VI secretion system protein ImpH
VTAPPGSVDALAPEELEALGLDPSVDLDLAARQLGAARRRGAYPLLLVAERLLGPAGAVGTGATFEEERIRLRHDPQLAFRAGEVSDVRVRAPSPDPHAFTAPRHVLEITTAFLGLTGAASPLPPYISEEIAQEDEDAPRRRDFLDLFHHRFISLFYRARARADHPNGYRSDQSDAWSTRVLALLGRDRPPRVERWRLLRWAPLLAERNVTPAALASAVADVLERELPGVGVEIEPFVGGWAEIDPVDQNQLGRVRSTLGKDLVLGRRIRDRGGKFRILIGPLGREALERLQARKELLRAVREAVVELCPPSLEYEVALWLSKDAAPHLELGRARLGRDTWLGGQVRETRLTAEIPA